MALAAPRATQHCSPPKGARPIAWPTARPTSDAGERAPTLALVTFLKKGKKKLVVAVADFETVLGFCG